jgi:hypothetical protein
MTATIEALARRAVACPDWRWMPGMKLLHSGRIVHVIGQRVEATEHPWLGSNFAARNPLSGPFPDAPDLTDPATLGCLLALVREVYGSPHLYCRLSSTTRASDGIRAWEVNGYLDASRSPDGRGGSFRGWGYASEAEALVATLEAAP